MRIEPRFRIPFVLFTGWLFVVLPLVLFQFVLDPALTTRFFLTACFNVLFVTGFLFTASRWQMPGKLTQIAFTIVTLQLLWMLITSCWSINPGDALQEWARMFSVGVFLFIASTVVRKVDKPVVLLIRLAWVALLVMSVYGIIQLFPLVRDFIQHGKKIRIDLSISGSFGNKNFFSEVLTLLFPLFILGSRTEKGSWKLLSITGLLLATLWIVLLQTVAAWLAVAFGCVLALVLAARYRKKIPEQKNRKVRSGSVWMAGLVLILVTVAFTFYSQTENFKLLNAKISQVGMYWKDKELLSTTSKANNNSVYERILVWKNSLKLIQDHPLAGAGLNNWKILQPQYGIGGTAFLNSGMVHFEHPHNDYLLIWSEQGIPGILLWLLFFALFFRSIIRQLREKPDSDRRTLLLISAMAITEFLVLSFFGYPRSRYYVLLLLMVYSTLVFHSDPENRRGTVWSARYFRIVCAALLVGSLFALRMAWVRLSGEAHVQQAEFAQMRKDYSRMFREASKADSYYYPLEITSTPVAWYQGMAGFYSGDMKLALESFEKAEKINPWHLRVVNDLATVYEQSGRTKEAIALYKRGLRITPLFIEGLLNLSAAYFNVRQVDSAYFTIDKVPDVKMSGRDEKNYKNFLLTILYAEASRDTLLLPEQTRRKEYLSFLNNEKKLLEAYKPLRGKGLPFTKVLYTEFQSAPR